MAGFVLTGSNGGSFVETKLSPGDVVLQNEFVSSVTSTIGTTISAAQMFSGIITRSGPTAGFTDSIDTAVNILYQLSGGNTGSQPNVAFGTTFRLRIINTTGYTETISLANSGLLQGLGTFTLLTNTWRDFLFTILSDCQQNTFLVNTTSGSPTATLVFPVGQWSQPMVPAGDGDTIMNGASVTGTGIPANTTILGVTQGQGGFIGFTMSANATATGQASVTVGPLIKVDSIGSGSL